MNTKKALVATGVSAVVGLASVSGVVTAASAGTASTDQTTDTRQSLIDKIAGKFNLNKDEVKQVFDESRAEKDQRREQKFEARLTQAAQDGKITESQKTAILDKQQELKTYIDSIKGKTPDEQKQLIKTKLDELRQWAKDNGLEKYTQFALKQGRHEARHDMRTSSNMPAHDAKADASATNSPPSSSQSVA